MELSSQSVSPEKSFLPSLASREVFGHSTWKDAGVWSQYLERCWCLVIVPGKTPLLDLILILVGRYKVFTFKETIKQGEHTVVGLASQELCTQAIFGRAAWV